MREKLSDRGSVSKVSQEVADAMLVTRALKHQDRYWIGATDALYDGLCDPERLENAIELFSRAYLLRRAESALRRPLVPITWGPQENNGDDNALQAEVFELAGRIAKERLEPEEDLEEGAGLTPGR